MGAEIMGAGNSAPPGWHEAPGWEGWGGPNPPFHTPVFVLTHHPRPSIEMEGGTVFHFVDAEPQEALDLARAAAGGLDRSEEHTSELQSRQYLVCRLLLEKKKKHT